jgi:hypothetical protein
MNESVQQAQREYREVRDAYLATQAKADAAFNRYFEKLNAGEPTNGAQATRLSDAANYLSADLSSAAISLWNLDIDPETLDKSDGIELGFVP